MVWIQKGNYYTLVNFLLLLSFSYFSIGNDNGEIFFWKLDGENVKELAKLALPVQKVVRKTFLTSDCKYIIMSTDDGKLWYLQLESIPL